MLLVIVGVVYCGEILYSTKIFEGCKFCGFHCFPSKCEDYYCENEQMASHMVVNLQNLFSVKSNFNKSAKFIAHEIFALYGNGLVV